MYFKIILKYEKDHYAINYHSNSSKVVCVVI